MGRVDRRRCGRLLVSIALLYAGSAAAAGNLVVHFEGLTSDAGTVVASLVDSAEQFLSREQPPRRSYSAKITNGKATWVIDDLAVGTYAISAYHDANSNARLDTGLFGVPTEDYGFSNDARKAFGAPDYADALFEFRQGVQTLTIRIE